MYQPLVASPLRPATRRGTPCLGDIVDAVAFVTGTPPDWLRSPSRKKRFVEARWVYYHIAKEREYTFPQIARAVKRHHTSVMHGYNMAREHEKKFSSARAQVIELLQKKFPDMLEESYT